MTAADPPPAAHAATPESGAADRPVHAVGIGPGDPAYLHPRARSILERADVVIGFETVLDHVESAIGGDALPCSYETEAGQLDSFAERIAAGATGAAALMGDPNVSGYTFLGKVERAVDHPVRVVPGISSIQVAASRARTPLESSIVVTLHTRGDLADELDRLVREAGDRHLLVLPRPYDHMPERIASLLTERGVERTLDVHVYERLTHDDESVTRTTLGDLARDPDESAFSDLSVMVIRGEP